MLNEPVVLSIILLLTQAAVLQDFITYLTAVPFPFGSLQASLYDIYGAGSPSQPAVNFTSRGGGFTCADTASCLQRICNASEGPSAVNSVCLTAVDPGDCSLSSGAGGSSRGLSLVFVGFFLLLHFTVPLPLKIT